MKQSDIWLINMDPSIGSEISKSRPAVIVNDNALGKLPLKVIVPEQGVVSGLFSG
jgi:mRNA interferase MazF